MAEKKATGTAGAAAPAAGFAAFFFSTRAWAAAESSRSPTSAVADDGDGALVAVLAFRRHDILRSTEHKRALSWRRFIIGPGAGDFHMRAPATVFCICCFRFPPSSVRD